MDYPPAQMAAQMAVCQFQLLFLLLLAILVVVQRFQQVHLVPAWVPGGCSSMVGGEGCFPFEGFAWRSFRFGCLRFGMAVE